MKRYVSWVVMWGLAGCLAHEEEVESVETPEGPELNPVSQPESPVTATRDASVRASEPNEPSSGPLDSAEPGKDSTDRRVARSNERHPIERPNPFERGQSKGADVELFSRAQAAGAAGEPERMRKLFLELVKDYPQSPLIPEVYVAFGDDYHAQGNAEMALRFYDKTRQYPSAPAAMWATYKSAWCHLALGDSVRALEGFAQTQKMVETTSPDQRERLEPLVVAVRHDIVLAYADAGRADRARVFFVRLGGSPLDTRALGDQLRELRRAYVNRDRNDDATIVCEQLAAMNEPCDE